MLSLFNFYNKGRAQCLSNCRSSAYDFSDAKTKHETDTCPDHRKALA